MTIEGKDKNHITFITTFIMIPLSLSTIGIGTYGLIMFREPIAATVIALFGILFFLYSICYGKENKYTVIIGENNLLYKNYPLFRFKKLYFKDIKKIIITSSKSVLYGDFSCLMIEIKGFRKALFFSSFSITKKDIFNNFINKLSSMTNMEPERMTHNEIQKAFLLIFK